MNAPDPRLTLLAALAAIILAGPSPLFGRGQAAKPPADVLILAASSLQTVLDDLVQPIRQATGTGVRISYAASSSLARQVESGAPADVFISADLDWMDYLANRRLIRPASRINLAGNTLVLIAPRIAPVTLKISPDFPLAAMLGRNRLAIADPASVPAGKYAQAALTSLGVWHTVSTRIAAAENVRAALLLVSRGEAALGIVYYSDAIADSGVEIVDTFPESTHKPIVYPAALTTVAQPAAARVLEFLKSDAAWPAFQRQGFTKAQRN